jgi:hypothetical protein
MGGVSIWFISFALAKLGNSCFEGSWVPLARLENVVESIDRRFARPVNYSGARETSPVCKAKGNSCPLSHTIVSRPLPSPTQQSAP